MPRMLHGCCWHLGRWREGDQSFGCLGPDTSTFYDDDTHCSLDVEPPWRFMSSRFSWCLGAYNAQHSCLLPRSPGGSAAGSGQAVLSYQSEPLARARCGRLSDGTQGSPRGRPSRGLCHCHEGLSWLLRAHDQGQSQVSWCEGYTLPWGRGLQGRGHGSGNWDQ